LQHYSECDIAALTGVSTDLASKAPGNREKNQDCRAKLEQGLTFFAGGNFVSNQTSESIDAEIGPAGPLTPLPQSSAMSVSVSSVLVSAALLSF
jgi:hypothetical protein